MKTEILRPPVTFCAVLLGLLVISVDVVAAQDASLSLDAPFTDGAVLQRDRPIQLRGHAAPGETISVELGNTLATATSSSMGRWQATLPPQAPPGPYGLRVTSASGDTATVEDILVGDVFLCSGQSNMEWPVSRSTDAETAIAAAANPQIRMLSISQSSSPRPLSTFSNPPAWEAADPKTVGDWSAVCYYFGRDLHQHLGMPIGLINSSWGGSNIRAWMSTESLAELGDYDDDLAILQLYRGSQRVAQAAFGEKWHEWWRRSTTESVSAPWLPDVGTSWTPAPDTLGNYKLWDGSGLEDYHGAIWFRATAQLTEAHAGGGATLNLGGVDEVDQTWVNGHVVGNTFGWGTTRTYEIPADLLRAGENVVVTNVLNTWGAGGLVGPPNVPSIVTHDGSRIPLADWRYRAATELAGYPPRAPWESIAGLSTIHNAMIAPLKDFGLRGVLWYQGESNTGEAGTYEGLLRSLIGQWRRQFGPDLPALIVQLANFGPMPSGPVESGWAGVREAQRRVAAADPLVAVAVTIDIGEGDDIHPRNKLDVGQRLFRAARNVVYGESISPSGPTPEAAVRVGNEVVVTFSDVTGSLRSRPAEHSGFELCAADPRTCRRVDSHIDGNRVSLMTASDAPAARVRYCWADNPVCPLSDDTGRPVGPFEIDVER